MRTTPETARKMLEQAKFYMEYREVLPKTTVKMLERAIAGNDVAMLRYGNRLAKHHDNKMLEVMELNLAAESKRAEEELVESCFTLRKELRANEQYINPIKLDRFNLFMAELKRDISVDDAKLWLERATKFMKGITDKLNRGIPQNRRAA